MSPPRESRGIPDTLTSGSGRLEDNMTSEMNDTPNRSDRDWRGVEFCGGSQHEGPATRATHIFLGVVPLCDACADRINSKNDLEEAP